MIFKRKKIGVISLGCDKNRVDTEKMLTLLGHDNITQDISEAQIIIINSCAFLESSRKEAIDTVLECNEYRENGVLEKIVLTGCLPQKFIGELFDDFTEVDVFLGINDYELLPEAIERAYNGERVNLVGAKKTFETQKRVVTTPLHYAYLKIADGCDNHCTYCLIPKIRGKYRSVPVDDLLEETKNLGEINELILVAQDVAAYGKDLFPRVTLTELIRKLSALPNVKGIRLLYCYPENITDELIHEMAVNAKVIRYIDVPLQHASDSVLKRMNRKGTGAEYLALIEKLRREVAGIAIRSTFITGFPAESEEDFDALVGFLQKAKLDAAGFFKYSREKDTPADKLDGHLKESVKTARLKKLYSVQKKIVKENNKKLVGKTFNVLAEGFDENALVYYGRAYFNAPDVDGKIYFFSDSEVEYGKYLRVKITKVTGYDLYGERV